MWLLFSVSIQFKNNHVSVFCKQFSIAVYSTFNNMCALAWGMHSCILTNVIVSVKTRHVSIQSLAYCQSLKSHNFVTAHCNVYIILIIKLNHLATFWCKAIEDRLNYQCFIFTCMKLHKIRQHGGFCRDGHEWLLTFINVSFIVL